MYLERTLTISKIGKFNMFNSTPKTGVRVEVNTFDRFTQTATTCAEQEIV